MTNNVNKSGNSDTELDFTEHWSFFNVHQEILRGIQLRQEKPVVNKAEYDLVDVDFSIPSCSKRKTFKDYQNIQTGKKINHRRYRKVTKKNKLSKKSSKDQHCPLRIVELAEPLKRQCLYTWKNNYSVLPDYMVDRLRRHVEDKNPVVQITDAVNYFKKKKHTSKKCSTKRTISKYSTERKIRDILLLCTIFGYKIAQKLKLPANIILSTKLAKINHIVSDEINSILRNKRGKDIYKNDKVLAEISKKVTIWIASVIEETSYKLLLEQLDELEEEEGPVLDFIDELLDNIPILRESSSSTKFTEENDIISTISSGDNIEVTESIYDNISKDTTDIEKPDYKANENIDPLLTKNTEESVSDKKNNNNINQENETKNHLRRLLEDKINEIVHGAGNADIEDNNNIELIGSNVNLSSSMNDANIDLSLNLENNTNNHVLGTDIDGQYINKNDTFISLDDLEADKTKNNTTSDEIKAELWSRIDEAIYEVSSDLEDNTNNMRLNTDKEFLKNDSNVISLDDFAGDMVENNTTPGGSKTDLSSRTDNYINELSITLENNITDVLPSKDKEYISQDDNFILLEDTARISKDYTSENIQSNSLPEGVDETQNISILESHTIDETEEEFEEGTKKVKFSNILLDNLRNNTGINKFEVKSYDYKQPVAWKSSKEYISSHFSLAPANHNLLSDMDELWPEYKLPPLLKATESVSKSVTSLGRIIESDERSLMSPIQKKSMENVNNSMNKGPDFTKINSIDEDKGIYNKIDSTIIEEDLLNEVFTKEWQRESKSMTDKMSIMNSKEDPKIILTTRENITQDCGDVKNIKHNIATQCDVLHTKISLANKDITKIKIDQNIQTSNVIIFSRDDKMGLKNDEIKIWCIGLENVTANLELWAEWIHNVCVNASRLKRNTSKGCRLTTKHIKKWIDLKQRINVDVQRWIELKTHLHRGLNKYKKTFEIQKTSCMQADKKNCKCNKIFKKYKY